MKVQVETALKSFCHQKSNKKGRPALHENFFNTLTANYEYSRSNTDNLPLPVQMQLSLKLKRFSEFFIAFFQSALNFEHFEKKVSVRA